MKRLHLAVVLFLFCCCPNVQSLSGDYFWVITDIHYDPTYLTWRISCSPVVMATDVMEKEYGHPNCDSPWTLVKSAVEGMKEIGPHPAFILFGG
jgi:sphingomyelin phosphodiesterase acid-like 3